METDNFIQAFVAAEAKTLDVLHQGTASMNVFRADLSALLSRYRAAVASGQVDAETKRTVNHLFHNIKDTAAYFLKMENDAQDIENTILKESSNILVQHRNYSKQPSSKLSKKSHSKQSKKSSSSPVDDASLEETTKFRPCRDYFLDHLGSPYPNASQKKAMAEKIGCTVVQVNQWFTNYRRRVGWLDVMKNYAQDNKIAMMALVDDVLRPKPGSSTSSLIPPAARQAVLEVKEKVTRLTMPNVSDAFREALMMQPMTDEELAEFANERKSARKQISETAEAQKMLEERKARKAARAKARSDRAAAFEADAAKLGVPVAHLKRKRNDENAANVSNASTRGSEEPRRIKKVRIARHEDSAASFSNETRPRSDLPFAVTEETAHVERRSTSPLAIPKRKRHHDDTADPSEASTSSAPRHPASSKRRRLADSDAQKPTNNKGAQPPRTSSAPSALPSASSSEVPFLIPDPEKVAELQRTSSLPNSFALGALVHQYGDSMLPPLTAEQQAAFMANCYQPAVPASAPISSTQPISNFPQYSISPESFAGAAPSTPTSSPLESHSHSFEIQLNGAGSAQIDPTFLSALLSQPTAQPSQPQVQPSQHHHQNLFDPSFLNMGASGTAFQHQSSSAQMAPSHHDTPQSFELSYFDTVNMFTPQNPEIYDSIIQSFHQPQQLSNTSNPTPEDFSSVPEMNITIGANGELEWTASTPPFSMPSPFELQPQSSSDTPRGTTPIRSRNVSASSSFSLGTDVGSIGAMRRSHSPQARSHAHPYEVASRLERLQQKERELEAMRAEVEAAKQEVAMAMALSQSGMSDMM